MLLAKTLRSSTFKLALICVGVFGLALSLILAYVYWSTAAYIRGRSDRAIAAEQKLLQSAYDQAGRGGLVAAIGQRIAAGRLAGGVYLLADPYFAPVAGNLKIWPAALQDRAGWGDFRAWENGVEGAEPPLLRAAYATLANGDRLLVGASIDELDRFVGTIRTALFWGAALMCGLAGFAALSVTRRTVGRIEAINATSRAIMQSGLDMRIPLRGSRDEWDKLAENLNSMLDRIQQLVWEVRHVTDNIAHDLQAPLSALRTRLEQARAAEPENEQLKCLVAGAIGDLDGIFATFASLLRISQIEAMHRRASFRTINLSQIAAEAAAQFQAAAEQNGSRIVCRGEDGVLAAGDRDLVFDAVAHLVDNAVKYGGAGEIAVGAGREGDAAVVTVADRGPGIPAEQRDLVFRRFHRLENSRELPGSGLGLSLVAAVAQLHEARIELADNAPGLKAILRFSPPAPGRD